MIKHILNSIGKTKKENSWNAVAEALRTNGNILKTCFCLDDVFFFSIPQEQLLTACLFNASILYLQWLNLRSYNELNIMFPRRPCEIFKFLQKKSCTFEQVYEKILCKALKPVLSSYNKDLCSCELGLNIMYDWMSINFINLQL